MAKKKSPSSKLARLLHAPKYKHNGIHMLTDFVKHLSLNSVTDRLVLITELVKLKMEPNIRVHVDNM